MAWPPRAAAVVLLSWSLVPGATAAGGAVDLEGTWHVLVHYRDSQTAHPDAWRWEDRVWVFEHLGSRLRWTDYPIVVFEDKSGRFERSGGNRAARVLHAWEPNPAQLRQIHEGLEINERGSKKKTLRGSDAEGWRSAGSRGPQAVNVFTYSETWSIEDPTELPLLVRDESLAGGMSESLEGHTEWRTEAVEEGGDVLRGSFDRDGTRVGTFRLVRAGAVGLVKGSGRTQGQRVMEMFVSQMGGDEGLAAVLANPRARGAEAEAARRQIRAEVRKSMDETMRAQGMDPRRFQPEIERMVDQIMDEWERGRSPEEIQRMIREGKIRPDSGVPVR